MTDLEPNRPLPVTAAPRTGRRFASYLGALLLCSVVVAGGYYALRGMTNSGCNGDCQEQEGPIDYKDWKKPLAALVLSGQMHGYVDPCGCSIPQFGGLPRRFNFIESLKAKKWDVVGIDLGELASLEGIHEQRLLKFDLSVKALASMNYRAFGIGKHEMLLPLGEGLAQIWDDKRSHPRPISLSLAGVQPGGMFNELNVRPYEIIDTTKPKIGVISMIWPAQPQNNQKWLNNMTELPKALKAFADANVEVGVILHHEYPVVEQNDPLKKRQEIEDKRRERALECANFCADARKKNAKIPPILLMMLLTDEPEPPMFLKQLDPKLPTQTIEIGHKGRYVGLIGIYKDKDSKGYRLQHQNVKIGPDWDSKPGEEARNPVTALMEKFNQDLKRGDMLAKFPRSLHYNQVPAADQKGLRATYVGSKSCQECHPHAFKVWEKTDHHLATKTLEDARHPSGRQFDPECMRCHTTGFQHPGGYNDPIANIANWPPPAGAKPAPAVLQKHNELLRGVGCENCHGPGSEHVKNPNNKALYALINLYRPSDEERKLEAKPDDPKFKSLFNRRMNDLGVFCMKCHNEENDVHWTETAAKWLGKRIVHRTPRNNNGAGNPAGKIGDPVPTPVIEIVEDKK